MARSFSVTDFKSNLSLGGARATLFQVEITPPAALGINADLNKLRFLARATTIPASNLGMIGIPYFGRMVKMAGDRTFDPWNVTIINDEDFTIRNSIESWMNAINSNTSNVRALQANRPSTYTSDASVTQYGKTGETLKTYNFVGLFPIDLAPIELDWGSNDTMEEFQVTFAYQYWEANTTS